MFTIKLMNEYLHGPIWVYDGEGFVRRKFDLVYDDVELRELNEKAQMLYDSFYSFNEEEACVFDDDGYKAHHNEMLDIVNKILARLDAINDGSFVVENYIK